MSATVTFTDDPVTSTVSSDRYDFITINGDKIKQERAPVNLATTVTYIQGSKDGDVTTFAAAYTVVFPANEPLTLQGNIRHILFS